LGSLFKFLFCGKVFLRKVGKEAFNSFRTKHLGMFKEYILPIVGWFCGDSQIVRRFSFFLSWFHPGKVFNGELYTWGTYLPFKGEVRGI